MQVEFRAGELTAIEQAAISRGFAEHAASLGAPAYTRQRLNWLVRNERGVLVAALCADRLWDWLYIDEVWVLPVLRNRGVGRRLMERAEDLADSEGLQGVWLWTQSWQAAGFYTALGYAEFARFENFPVGHARIGFRKALRAAKPT